MCWISVFNIIIIASKNIKLKSEIYRLRLNKNKGSGYSTGFGLLEKNFKNRIAYFTIVMS